MSRAGGWSDGCQGTPFQSLPPGESGVRARSRKRSTHEKNQGNPCESLPTEDPSRGRRAQVWGKILEVDLSSLIK
jgi:hypothetical protein